MLQKPSGKHAIVCYVGGAKFYKSDLEMLVLSSGYVDSARITLVSTACHSGLFVSSKWTSYVAAHEEQQSLSYSQSGSGIYRGEPWTTAFLSTLAEHPEEELESFGNHIKERTLRKCACCPTIVSLFTASPSGTWDFRRAPCFRGQRG
jgi:hypothetical protein